MENFKLTTTQRSDVGKGVARRMRAVGRVPAILYGHKEAPMGLSAPEKDLRAILHEHPDSAIVDLSVEGHAEPINTIVRDVQRHPASGKLLHVDFQRIRLDEKVRVDVHVEIEGSPAGVKEQGGILEHGVRSVSVMCLPGDIPEAIVIDVTLLRIHDSTRIKDVAADYPGVEFLDGFETALATVIPPIVEAAPPEPEAEEGEEPEVITREKKEDEEEEEKKDKKEKTEGGS
jgi:large subunit ribosomal protein L25